MKSLVQNLIPEVINQAISNKTVRKLAVRQLDKKIHDSILEDNSLLFEEEKLDRYYFVSNVVKQVSNCIDKGYISKNVARRMLKVFMSDSFKVNREAHLTDVKCEYKEKYNEYPPKFLVLSPEKACNLECVGCYASCTPGKGTHLDFTLTQRIVREAHDILGSRFITISGGEPLMYSSQGKTILDIFEEFSDMFFLMYTNGTLINKQIASRLAELGNVVPLISVEGYEKETDERRGKGVHKKIREAMSNLREVGVPFGISVTATTKNYEILLTDDFYKYYFDEMGATHMWQFQLMPIGKGKDVMELMITPQQRVEFYKKGEYVTRELRYPMADFWNSSSLCTGCIAYGRWNGYFYIDFDGKVAPCVFVPYYVDKIQDIYDNGGNLADAIQSQFFKNGRNWQRERGFDQKEHKGDYLMIPCSIRDNYANFRKNILTPEAKGIDREAKESLHDKEYKKIMIDYGQELDELTKKIYDRKYRKSLAMHTTK
ncbi:radical SAM/SPASM domain-containing protein [Maribellus sp. YY47]|uniref:radical SAM/SPASM domain-containing protein n=1 Tax=Maribellus sp. YY47 TaxID=2929486 RepID=UPI002000BF27|nr:radical SAM/SPASM domain-containing protein [Maribellus sp. YY47]MCK3683090.1 radical SAM protein [Maribellus sp. YY47]